MCVTFLFKVAVLFVGYVPLSQITLKKLTGKHPSFSWTLCSIFTLGGAREMCLFEVKATDVVLHLILVP